MVYPEEAGEELQKIIRLTHTYRAHGLNVPEVRHSDDKRVLLLQDLGDTMVQKAISQLKSSEEKNDLLEKVADILIRLKDISLDHTDAVLGTERMKWEMDFFIQHFAPHFLEKGKDSVSLEGFKEQLHLLVDAIQPLDTFGHRDFHSRNMLMVNGDIFLVDFQDSLVGPAYYDLVSFAFDSYLDLDKLRESLFDQLKIRGFYIDEEQMYLTALERNIKALGTFGFQVTQRENLTYKKYIARTIRHITGNPMYHRYFAPDDFN
jgi:aminoglycoside/choline kinase family phosphotransferase